MTTEQRLFWLGGFAAAGVLLYFLSPVLTPFIAAALLAYLGDPIADRLQRMRVPRSLAVVIVFVLTFFGVGAIILLLFPLIESQVSALFDALPRYMQLLEEKVWPYVAEFIAPGAEPGEIGVTALLERFGGSATSWGQSVLSSLGRSSGALLSAATNLVLIPILTFYLLRDWDAIIARFAALVPERGRETVVTLARETDETLGAFLRGQLLVMLGLSILYTTGLSLIGLKFALAIGVVSGLVSFVPYLGFILGIGLASLTAMNEPNNLLLLLGVVATFSIAQVVEGSLLTPKLVGDRIGLHPVLVIFAVMAFGQLFGFFGVLLALPAAAVLVVLVRFAYNRYLREHPEAGVDLNGGQDAAPEPAAGSGDG